MTPFATCLAVWKYWHSVSTASTLISRPAKQRVSLKPKIQTGLKYHDAAVPAIKRNRMFMERNWNIVNETFKCLYTKYSSENPDSPVSYGTFWKLKPSYVGSVTTKDVEMCCCKKIFTIRFSTPFPVHVLKITIQPLPIGIVLNIKRSFVPMLQRNGVKLNKS